MVHPSVRIDANHRFHAERFERPPRGASPPSAARRAPAARQQGTQPLFDERGLRNHGMRLLCRRQERFVHVECHANGMHLTMLPMRVGASKVRPASPKAHFQLFTDQGQTRAGQGPVEIAILLWEIARKRGHPEPSVSGSNPLGRADSHWGSERGDLSATARMVESGDRRARGRTGAKSPLANLESLPALRLFALVQSGL